MSDLCSEDYYNGTVHPAAVRGGGEGKGLEGMRGGYIRVARMEGGSEERNKKRMVGKEMGD